MNDEGNQATVEEEEWDVEAFSAETQEVVVLTVTTEKQKNKLDDWIMDSGCSNHLTGEIDRLQNAVKYGGSRVVVIADNSKHNIAHIGDVNFQSECSKQELVLRDVYHVPGMKKNLISVPQLTADGHYVLFVPKDVKVYKHFETRSTPILQGCKTDKVYVLNAESAYVEKTKGNQTTDLWHQRLGHIGFDKLGLIMSKELISGLPRLDVNKDMVCSGCQYGKAKQLPFKSSRCQCKEPLELVHSDVFGPVKQSSMSSMRYMVLFIDDFSRFMWIYFMKEKTEVFSKYKLFEVAAETMTGNKVKCLRSDSGGEYMVTDFCKYLDQRRVEATYMSEYTTTEWCIGA